ncbi:MAG: hypothetical protein CMJ83_18750 [Planctomycetes bacterium]|nr:hypothetical protein [Planctomycetota bacterium]
MPAPGPSQAYQEALLGVEQRSQEHTCWTLGGTILACAALACAILTAEHRAVIVAASAALFAFFVGSAMVIRRGNYHRSFKYANVLVQVSMVTGIVWIDAEQKGATYALSSMPPLSYALVVAISSMTISPQLCLVTGILAGGQFIALYSLVLRPMIPEPDLATNEVNGWGITLMKSIVLLAIGIAAGLMARRARRLLGEVEIRAIAEGKLRNIDRELASAVDVQRRLIPQELPEVPGLELFSEYVPSRRVGGDAFDLILLPNGRLLVMIADVAGKGYPAALTMAAVTSTLRALVAAGRSPQKIVPELNSVLCHSSVDGRFVTMFIAEIDPRSGALSFVNAGHNRPMIVNREGEVRELAAGGPVVGAVEGLSWKSGKDRLAPRELLFTFTDGLTELRAPDGEQFGEERVADVLRRTTDDFAGAVVGAMLDAVDDYLDGGSVGDDLTFVGIRRRD